MASLKYRPEIDGLRAIAVLAVVVYHANLILGDFQMLPGGFLGVDIFFVISGYLISTIILNDIAAGKFSFLNFYERRARRILPALFLVILVSIPFALLWLLPDPFKEYVDSVISTLLFASNFYFWQQDSYTSVASGLKPFLHTWSLSIEEQFYLIFPFLMIVLWKKLRPSIQHVFIGLFVASLALAQWSSYAHPDANFYLLPTRAWELLGGAILAKFAFDGYKPGPDVYLKWMPLLGTVMVFYSLIFFRDDMHHPALPTLMPVAGAMIILWFTQKDRNIGWILSWKPVVFIGLVSYSFYLWHQPVFAFARVKEGLDLPQSYRLGLISLSFVLAIFSWWFVERPFRDRTRVSTRKLWISLGVIALLIGAACYVQKEFELKEEYYPEKGKAAEAVNLRELGKIWNETRCMKDQLHPYCIRGDLKGERWITLGDSHLLNVSGYLWHRLKDKGATVTFMERGGCGYVPGMEVLANGKPDACTFDMNDQREKFIKDQPPSIIVVMERYPLYIEGVWFDNREGGIEDTGTFTMRPNGKEMSEPLRQKAVMEGMTKSINDLLKAGHKVVLIYPVPEAGWDVPANFKNLTSKMKESEVDSWMKEDRLSTSYAVFKDRSRRAYQALDAIPDQENLIRIYPEKLFCNIRTKGRCSVHDHKGLFYSDDDHLAPMAAKRLVDQIIYEVDKKWNRD